MLLPREQSSWNCGYFLGAIALKVLNQSEDGKVGLPELQERMSDIISHPLSATQIVAAASWLYLIDAIKLDDEGMIAKCI